MGFVRWCVEVLLWLGYTLFICPIVIVISWESGYAQALCQNIIRQVGLGWGMGRGNRFLVNIQKIQEVRHVVTQNRLRWMVLGVEKVMEVRGRGWISI